MHNTRDTKKRVERKGGEGGNNESAKQRNRESAKRLKNII